MNLEGLSIDMSGINNREYRYLFFRLFQSYAEDWFKETAARDPRHEMRTKVFGFYIAKFGKLGGIDKRECDIFYGLRPFDRVREFKSLAHAPTERLLVQQGGGLAYRRSDNGYVICLLHPPRTESTHPSVDAIIIELHLQPRVLLSKHLIAKHFQYYSTCFECCDLDGYPTLRDQIVYFWLRVFHRRVLGGKIRRSIAHEKFIRSIEFAFTVGLSGFILLVITRLFPGVN